MGWLIALAVVVVVIAGWNGAYGLVVGKAARATERRAVVERARSQVASLAPELSSKEVKVLAREVAWQNQLLDRKGLTARCYLSGLRLRDHAVETPAGAAPLASATLNAVRVGRTAHKVSYQKTRPTLTRTVAGGALLGPAGAVVAGLGLKKTKTKTKTVGSQGYMVLTVKADDLAWSRRMPTARSAVRAFNKLKAADTRRDQEVRDTNGRITAFIDTLPEAQQSKLKALLQA